MRSNRVQIEGTDEFHSRSWANWRVSRGYAVFVDPGETVVRLTESFGSHRDPDAAYDGKMRRQRWTSISAGHAMMGKAINAASGAT